VLFLVALLGVGLAAAGEAWESQRLRAAEVELLWAGDQYRRALGEYYRNASGCGPDRNRYPRELAHLLKDPRCPATVRYLRRLYPDPITGSAWGVLRAPDGGIAGVYSLSTRRPFKVADFRMQDRDFEGKRAYRDWVFVHAVANGRQAARAASQAAAGAVPPAPPVGSASQDQTQAPIGSTAPLLGDASTGAPFNEPSAAPSPQAPSFGLPGTSSAAPAR
jgi:hypothetical protein